jgi:hypothetical protein
LGHLTATFKIHFQTSHFLGRLPFFNHFHSDKKPAQLC